ncbi:MAG: hypothetical protein IJ097_02495 [Bacilli bacterium]|nr:hypothetical protein [Bacilli bacterium]
MNIEDLINIKKESIEDRIERAIQDTKDELNGLTTDTTCFIYSSVLADHLRKEHLANQIISTSEFDYPYIHQFNIVPKNNNELYLIDLTYQQFQVSEFKKLTEKGYILLNGDKLKNYLDIVGNVNINKRKTY